MKTYHKIQLGTFNFTNIIRAPIDNINVTKII